MHFLTPEGIAVTATAQGDNSAHAGGTWYEGCLTAGISSAATDAKVQANIVAAGYGR